MIKCNSCKKLKEEKDFQFRKDINNYRKTCRKCRWEASEPQRLLRRKNLTIEQKDKLKKQWTVNNKKAVKKRQELRYEKIELDLKKPIRVCSKCKTEKPNEDFHKYYSLRAKREVYKSSCKDCVCEQKRRKEKTPKGRYSNYKIDAKWRGYSFELTLEHFTELLNGDCFYCGKEKSWGIDRYDNSVGYTKDNAVSCCGVCNEIKMERSVRQLFKHLIKMVKHFKENKEKVLKVDEWE